MADQIKPNSPWLSAREIAGLRLPGLPATERGVQLYMGRSPIRVSRKRVGKGGGLEYHYMFLPLEAIVAYERQLGGPDVALDARALSGGATTIETADGGRLFALVRRLHLMHPEWSAALIRKECIAQVGSEIVTRSLSTGANETVAMPPISAFKRVLTDVRAFYSLGVATRRVGFDRVFDRFARARMVVTFGESNVLKLEQYIREIVASATK